MFKLWQAVAVQLLAITLREVRYRVPSSESGPATTDVTCFCDCRTPDFPWLPIAACSLASFGLGRVFGLGCLRLPRVKPTDGGTRMTMFGTRTLWGLSLGGKMLSFTLLIMTYMSRVWVAEG